MKLIDNSLAEAGAAEAASGNYQPLTTGETMPFYRVKFRYTLGSAIYLILVTASAIALVDVAIRILMR